MYDFIQFAIIFFMYAKNSIRFIKNLQQNKLIS